MKNKISKRTIENFLSTLDYTISIEIHKPNAYWDSFQYNWNDCTTAKIMEGIEDAYSNKTDESAK